MFACAYELDRRPRSRDRREGTTTFRSTIQLGNQNRAYFRRGLECSCLLLRLLSNCPIHDEHDLIRPYCFGDLVHLIHQGFLFAMPAC